MEENARKENDPHSRQGRLFVPPFGPSANVVTRYLFASFAVLFVFGLYFWYVFARSDYLSGASIPVAQPVLFSHRHHAGDLGIDCRYCHNAVDDASFAGLPSTETCMTCHSQLFTDSPMLEPVRRSFATGIPIHWNRVYDLAEFTYFHHGIHVSYGIDCAECHGDVADMPLVHLAQPLHMDWCLECHRRHEPTLPPPPDPSAAGASALASIEAHQALQHPVNPLTNCSTCHR